MFRLSIFLAGFTILSSSIALAQPKPFAREVSFVGCTTSWAFACGMRDAQGRTYGTAHQQKHCETFTFRPNGTYQVFGDLGAAEQGTYKVSGAKVTLTPLSDDGSKSPPFVLELAADGSKLGTMTKL